jgi:hypothetical protein
MEFKLHSIKPDSSVLKPKTVNFAVKRRSKFFNVNIMTSPERDNSITKPAIDREKTTPFLLRLFIRTGGFHRYRPLSRPTNSRLEEFETPDRIPVDDEVQIYTW